MTVPRYRFGDFTLSPRRRLLLRHGQAVPLIPRYFDLLLYLVERRGEAVHRRDIFDRVWNDVVVSDSALSQAVRTIRRVLEDDSREPRFVRTVARHGYEFVFTGLVEEDDEVPAPLAAPVSVDAPGTPPADVDPFAPLLAALRDREADDEQRREAAEALHLLGTSEALRRIDEGPDAVRARALLRDTRWAIAQAGPVPILGTPQPVAVAREVVRLRLRRAAGEVAARWGAAAAGGGAAGLAGGGLGGVLLATVPGGTAPASVIPVLATVGAGCGAFGAAGVGVGLAVAEAAMRSRRRLALTAGAAAGGAAAGLVTELLARWTLAVLVGVHSPIGGTIEGLLIGAAAGWAYALATPASDGGFAAPRGAARIRLALMVAVACGLAGLLLDLAGRPLVGGTIHLVAQASDGAQAVLTPLGRLIGEPGFGPVTAALISLWEGALFGAGLATGLTHRRRNYR